MGDPGWTTAVANELHEDLGFGLSLFHMNRSLELFLHPQSSSFLVDHLDLATRGLVGPWRLTACTPGLDTDDDGLVYVRVKDEDPGADEVTLEFYRGPAMDGGAGDELVAQATGDNSDTLTIVPEAGYTLAGEVDVGVIGAGLDEHDFLIHVQVPPAQRIRQLFDGDHAYDELIRTEALARLRTMRQQYVRARQEAARLAEFIERTEIAPTLVGGRTGDQLFAQNIEVVRGGGLEDAPSGLLHDHKQAMAANTGTAGVVKAAAGAWSGTPTFPGAYQGKTSAPTYNQRARPATITFACSKKLTGSAPQLTARRVTTDPRFRPNEDGTGLELYPIPLTIGADWQAPEWGIDALRIDYKPSVSGVTNSAFSTTTTDWSVTGLTSDNSTNGVVYPYYDGSAVKVYKTAAGRTAQDTSDIVASATLANTAVGTTFTATGATGISITGKSGVGSGGGPTLATGSVADVDFQAPTVTGGSYALLAIAEDTAPGSWVATWRDGGVGNVPAEVNTGDTPTLKAGWVERGLPMINTGVSGARV